MGLKAHEIGLRQHRRSRAPSELESASGGVEDEDLKTIWVFFAGLGILAFVRWLWERAG